MKKSTRDLTTGNITKELLLFMLPILVGQVFQNLYNSVDAIVVGNAVGKTALAAVSSSADISMLLTGFFTGFATGGGVIIARYFGAKNYEKLHLSIHTLILFALIIGVVMAAVGVILSPALLHVVNCPPDVYDEALVYLRIYLIGILFTSIYNVGAGVLRAVGDSQRPFYYLVIASVVNIIMDVVCVVFLKMGVSGAALATVVSQFISVLLVYIRMIRTDDVYKLVPKDLKIDRSILKEVVSIGFPAAIQSSLISISNLFVQRYYNAFGSSAMAGIGAAKKVDKFVSMIAQSLGLALSTFVSQNMGAKKAGRAFQGIRASLIVSFIYILTVGSAVWIFADFFINIFTKDADAVGYGVSMIRVMLPLYFFLVLNQVFANAVRGFGKSFVVMLFSVIGMIGCRQLFLFISMKLNYCIENVYVAMPVGWACAGISVMIYYFIVIRSKYRNVKAGDDTVVDIQNL